MKERKKHYYKVPVVYEVYGTVEVEAESAEDAYNYVKNHPGDFSLHDDIRFVDDDLRVEGDDPKSAMAMIRLLNHENGAASGRRTGLTVKATVTFQKWEGDYAVFNGEAEFDACDALDSMGDVEIARVEDGDPYALDAVYKAAVRLGQIHDYDGPFEVDLDEDNLYDYLKERRKGE